MTDTCSGQPACLYVGGQCLLHVLMQVGGLIARINQDGEVWAMQMGPYSAVWNVWQTSTVPTKANVPTWILAYGKLPLSMSPTRIQCGLMLLNRLSKVPRAVSSGTMHAVARDGS